MDFFTPVRTASFVLVVGLVITVLAVVVGARHIDHERKDEAERTRSFLTHSLQSGLDTATQRVVSLALLFSASDDVRHDEFVTFASGLGLEGGVQALGLARFGGDGSPELRIPMMFARSDGRASEVRAVFAQDPDLIELLVGVSQRGTAHTSALFGEGQVVVAVPASDRHGTALGVVFGWVDLGAMLTESASILDDSGWTLDDVTSTVPLVPHYSTPSSTTVSSFDRYWEVEVPAPPTRGRLVMLAVGGLVGVLVALALALVSGLFRRKSLDRQQEQWAKTEEDQRARFLTAVSHELRTPLTAILGLSAELARDGDSFTAQEREELTGVVERQALIASETLDDLFVAVRLSRAEPLGWRTEFVDVARELSSVLERFDLSESSMVIGSKQCALGDSMRVRQALRHVVGSLLAGGESRIDIEVTVPSDQIVVSVAGSGTTRPCCFGGSFLHRPSCPSAAAPPVGSKAMGLPIAAYLAAQMNGALVYHPDDSNFELRLPIARANSLAAA